MLPILPQELEWPWMFCYDCGCNAQLLAMEGFFE